MGKFLLEHNRPDCIGCGACASVCDEVFEMKEKNGSYKAVAKKKESDLPCVKEAADVCPIQPIKIS